MVKAERSSCLNVETESKMGSIYLKRVLCVVLHFLIFNTN